jgi:uncharacterized protein (DUF924 family)
MFYMNIKMETHHFRTVFSTIWNHTGLELYIIYNQFLKNGYRSAKRKYTADAPVLRYFQPPVEQGRGIHLPATKFSP